MEGPRLTPWQHLVDALRRISPARRRAASNHVGAAPSDVRDQIDRWRQVETVSGALALAAAAGRPPETVAGVERCYYEQVDLDRVTWVGPHMPTPFVGYAPLPGPMASGSINRMQFRYSREIEMPKPVGVFRVFVTGGSTTYGAGASSNETTIGGYLEKRLNAQEDLGVRFEVVTAAAAAWTSTHERIVIENRLVELAPDIVVSFSGHNDVFWGHGSNSLWQRVFHDSYFLALINTALEERGAEPFPAWLAGEEPHVTPALASDRLTRNAALAAYTLSDVGAVYVFALQPVMRTTRKPLTPREQAVENFNGTAGWYGRMDEFFAEFRSHLGRLDRPNFHFVDSTPAFDSFDNKTDLFLDSCHFGDRGNDAVAAFLAPYVLAVASRRLERGRPQKSPR